MDSVNKHTQNGAQYKVNPLCLLVLFCYRYFSKNPISLPDTTHSAFCPWINLLIAETQLLKCTKIFKTPCFLKLH